MTEQRIKTTINGKNIEVERDRWAIDVIREMGIEVPSLCHHAALEPYGACRLCVVEVTKGRWTWLTTSCDLPLREGLRLQTESESVQASRRLTLELMLARAPRSHQLQEIAASLGVTTSRFQVREDRDKCILCGLCVRVCDQLVGASAIGFSERGGRRQVVTPFQRTSPTCVGCQACLAVCPTGHIETVIRNGALSVEPFNTTLDMVCCQGCHQPYIPARQLKQLETTLGDKMHPERLCPDCLRRRVVERHVCSGVPAI